MRLYDDQLLMLAKGLTKAYASMISAKAAKRSQIYGLAMYDNFNPFDARSIYQRSRNRSHSCLILDWMRSKSCKHHDKSLTPGQLR